MNRNASFSVPEPSVLLPSFAPVLRDRKRMAKLPPARAHALAILDVTIRSGSDVQASLDAELKHTSLSRQDAALCTELVYGYLRSEIRLSWLVRRFLKAPSKLPPGMFALLCLATYELTSLDRIPAYASVDWAVGAVRALYGEGVARLANAVLRNMARLDGAWADPAFYECIVDQRERLAVRYASPRWLVDLWCDAYGDATATALLAASCGHPAPGIRVNPLYRGTSVVLQELLDAVPDGRLSDNAGTRPVCGPGGQPCASRTSAGVCLDTGPDVGLDAGPGIGPCVGSDAGQGTRPEVSPEMRPGAGPVGTTEAGPEALPEAGPEAGAASGPIASLAVSPAGDHGIMFLQGAFPGWLGPLVEAGAVSRQSGASQAALAALEPTTWAGPVWDCCCGRGGKTAALVELGVQVVVASDPSLARLRGLRRDFERLGLALPLVVRASAVHPPFVAVAPDIRTAGPSPDVPAFVDARPASYAMTFAAQAFGQEGPTFHDACCGDAPKPPAPALADVTTVAGAGTPPVVHDPIPAHGAHRLALQADGHGFGAILVDAPCSGLGTLARRPDIKRKRTRAQLDELCRLQEAILEAVWPLVRKGGVLAYVTCTRNPLENEGRIAAFLASHADAGLEVQHETALDDPSREFFFAARVRKR